MRSFDSNIQVREAIMEFYATGLGSMPEDFKTSFKRNASSSSIVDQSISVMELMYASREMLDADGMDLVAGLAAYASRDDWRGLARSGRGQMIVQAMMRDIGEKAPTGVKYQSPDDDVPASPQYSLQPTPVPVAVPAAEVPAAEEPSTDVQS